jgi:acetyl-CoA acetyltransferase
MQQRDTSWMRNKEGLGLWEHRGQVAVAGVGHSPLDRRWDGKNLATSLGAYSVYACKKAIEDAGLELNQIDGIMVCPENLGDEWAPRPYFDPPYDSEIGITRVTGEWLIQQLGLTNVQYIDSNAPMIGTMFGKAAQAVGDGKAQTLLIVYPTGNLEGRYHHSAPENLSPRADGMRAFFAPWGHQGGAMMTTASAFTQYCEKYTNGDVDWLAPLAVNQRRNGLKFDWGFYTLHEPYQITEEDYLAARWVQKPIRLFDCDRPVNGSTAYIVTTASAAKDMKQKPIYVLNHCQTTGGGGRSTMPTLDETEEWCRSLARKMWEGAGMTVNDVDVFNPYDGYLNFTQNYLEGFQWHGVKYGESRDFYKGDITSEGPHPFCPSGGNNGTGRTRTGIFTDCIEQLRGTAGARQISGRRQVAIAGCVTPGGNGWMAFSTEQS